MDTLLQFVQIILHLDIHLNEWAAAMGPSLYIVLFLIIFCETGLVIFPFLPGDSLLFALGALAAVENSFFQVSWLLGLLTAAAILGNMTNYWIGRKVGPKVFQSEFRWLNSHHLQKTQAFYDKHGGKAVVLSRFMPILRTFVPFVAGIGKMDPKRYSFYNFVGGFSWVWSLILAGYFFGNLPAVKSNFHVVIVAIIVISFLPVVIEAWRSRQSRPKTAPGA